ncbi:MAG TPA: PASTA domain-containing protein [Saprospiraceae bacterium]|nr:PASTA domain-containing protein [Saprospiraceae bacterium]
MEKKEFIKQLIFIALFIIVVISIIVLWLGYYTNHGQKLTLPEYIDMYVKDAERDAKKRSFRLVIDDSVHIVGQRGGIITAQNPKGGSLVKEKRKIYVTVTKYHPDRIRFNELPALYGSDYEQKRKELSYLQINSNIKGFAYDPGQPNHILEVWYEGEIIASKNIERRDVEIEKGGTLEFVLSEQSGGTTTIPDLFCMTVAEARFLLDRSKLRMGDINYAGNGNPEYSFIVNQDPPYDPVAIIERGSAIHVTTREEKPPTCR